MSFKKNLLIKDIVLLFLSNNHLETIHGLEDYIIFGKHIL